jgi:hypothetical protein
MKEFKKIQANKRSIGNRSVVYGVGINDAWYQTNTRENGKVIRCPAYTAWLNMIRRCYSPKWLEMHPTYKGCSVTPIWHKFHSFSVWFEESYPDDGVDYQLDKDIKVKGNKVYSPETCLFVSKKDNVIAAHAKHYAVVSPDGVTHNVYNMRAFCRENGLGHAHMNAVTSGKRKSHKGFTL